MKEEKKEKDYIAIRRITFESLKGKPVVEPDSLLPKGVDAETIKDLLACGDIEEVK